MGLGPCEPWAGSYTSNGYGRKWIKGEAKDERRGWHVVATRWVWEQVFGPIPEGLVVRHKCDNPPCVRLNHLELGTQADNMQDASSRHRLVGTIPRSITPQQEQIVTELGARGLKHREIAQQAGVSQPSVSRILSGKQWSQHGRSS